MIDQTFHSLSNLIKLQRDHLSRLDSSITLSTDEIPFELVTQEDQHSLLQTEESLELISIWVIDCYENRWISKLFGFLKLLALTHPIDHPIDHLKTLRPLPVSETRTASFFLVYCCDDRVFFFRFFVCFFSLRNQVENLLADDQNTHLVFKGTHPGSSILLMPTSTISFQELTQAMLDHDPICGLIQESTPYRLRVPRRASRVKSESKRWSETYWPLDLHRASHLAVKLVGPNLSMIEKAWRPIELIWLLDQLKHVLNLARASYELGELGIATTVSSHDLEQFSSAKTLAEGVDGRLSTGNPLCHAFIEMIGQVARLDQLKLRGTTEVEDPMSIPYLLTNLVVFSTHEPCLCCSMALLHSRIKHLFYLLPSPGSGGCGSVFNVHEQDGLNHKFFTWKLKTLDLPMVDSNGFDA